PFAVGHRVPAFLHAVGRVARERRLQIGPFVADTLDLLARQVTRSIPDGEATVRRPVHQVCRPVRQLLQLGLAPVQLEDAVAARVAEPADEPIDGVLLAEALESGRDDEQLTAVADDEPRAVDRLVPGPGAAAT